MMTMRRFFLTSARLFLRRSQLPISPSSSYVTGTHFLLQKKGGGSSPPGGITLDSKKLDPPPSIFKETDSKELGPGAGKGKEYKNPEYFSYHQLSYADMDIVMSKLRCPQPSSVNE